MIFYNRATATSPRRTRMFLAEKDIEIETRQIDIARENSFRSSSSRSIPVVPCPDSSPIMA